MSEAFVYDRRLVVLHWLTAAVVAALWLGAQTIDWFPRGQRPPVVSLHILFGLTLVVVLAARVVVRLTVPGARPPEGTGWLNRAARAVHLGLYLLVGATMVAGMSNAWVRGDSLFGFFSLAGLAPADRALRRTIGAVHEWAANAVLFVALGHAAMALFHQYVLRDGLLRPMMPGR